MMNSEEDRLSGFVIPGLSLLRNAHFRELAESVKRGVLQAGGFPVEFPVMSLGETLIKPTAMLYRNLVSMDVEESIRANPIDGVVLLCGCDKTTPIISNGCIQCKYPNTGYFRRSHVERPLEGKRHWDF
jgi:dihydroxyacid dehydratase/phosphogluconate dehydratase